VINLVTTVRPTLVIMSASVIVESRDPSAVECIVAYHIAVVPTKCKSSPSSSCEQQYKHRHSPWSELLQIKLYVQDHSIWQKQL
jgi:hypothetical protein